MKNEYKITKDLIMSWAKEYHLYGAANILLFVLWCAVGVMGIVGTISLTVIHAEWTSIYLCVLIFAIAVYKLFIGRFVFWSKRYKMYSTTYGVAEWMRTIEFLDDEILLTDHTSVSRFKYSNIQKIKDKNNVIIIFMNDNMTLRLYKDAFTEGSWEECKSMIMKKKSA